MKIKSIIGLCAIALLAACGGSGSSVESENKFDPKPYNDSLANFIKENKTQLDELMANMESFAKEASDGKHKLNYKFKFEDSTLKFNPATGISTYTYGSPVAGFNAIYLSDNALLGTALPENLTYDIFTPTNFNRVKSLIKTGKYDHSTAYGEDVCRELHNDRVLLQSYLNLKYLVFIRNQKYTTGIVSAILGTYDVPYLEGALYVYDLKNKKYCGGGEFTSGGPKDLNYTYKEGDLDDQQRQAEYTLNAQTPDTIKYKTLRLLNEYVKVDDSSIDY